MSNYDLIIAGGGLVGASLAAGLRGTGARIAVVEAVAPGSPAQPSFDERQTALAPSSRRIFTALGLWPAIAAEAAAIRTVHVSDQGGFGITRMHAADEGLDALGHVVPNRVLGAVLPPAARAEATVEWLAPATVEAVAPGGESVDVGIRSAGAGRTLSARLLAVADGARSPAREALAIGTRSRDYGQSAVIANVRPERAHAGRAFERFTRDGPLAVLPAGDGRAAVIWTMPHERAQAVAATSEHEFLDALQRRFGWRLGRLLAAGGRAVYPLHAVTAERRTSARAVMLGNAAHTLHPVAGQGFNLALRDVAELAEHVAAAVVAGGDCGGEALLAGYAAARRRDHRRTFAFTDALVRGFSNRLPGVTFARNAGLLGLDLLPGARRMLMQQAMGRAGRQPRLSRGLPLDALVESE